jgi:putative nucleotidyltransferase with HDIG domain
MFGFGSESSQNGTRSSRFGTSARRREELRRNLPRPSPEILQWIRRPDFAGTLLLTLAFALGFALLFEWSRGQLRAFPGQIATSHAINPRNYEVENVALTEERREEARRTAPRYYVANGKYLSALKAKIDGLPVATFEKQSLAEIDADLVSGFDLTDAALVELQIHGGAKIASESWRARADRFIGSLWSQEPIVGSQEYQIFATTLHRYVFPPPIEAPADPTTAGPTAAQPAAGGAEPAKTELVEATQLSAGVAQVATRVDTAHELPPGVGPVQSDFRRALSRLAREAGFSDTMAPVIAAAVANDPRPTALFDDARTQRAAEQAALAVKPEMEAHLRGEVIFASGDRLTTAQIQRLEQAVANERASEPLREMLARIAGSFAVGLAVAVLVLLYTVRHEPKIGGRPGRLAGLFVLMLASAAVAAVASASFPQVTVPLAAAACLATAMVVALAYGQRFALFIAGILSIYVVLAVEVPPATAVVAFVGCATLVALLREVRHRAAIVRASGATAIVLFVGVLGLGALETEFVAGGVQQSLRDGFFSALASYGVGFLVLGTLPQVEKAFGICTGLSLAELRDPRHALLRQMQERAPGTYNHSLQVASLAEAAAESIGADGLLAYVGAMYHDIGKVNKPEYFVENQLGAANKHERLSPAMSLLVIVGHVKDGLELAKEYGLPKTLHHFIESHHGTTLVEYFFHRARSQAELKGETEDSVEEFDFRYPGPKPRTREAAILMLCDASESATRAIAEPTHGRIEALVRSLARKRLDDGQFDECPLTFAELRVVEDSIIKSLAAIHHGRIAYPSTAGSSGSSGPSAIAQSLKDLPKSDVPPAARA